MNEQTILVVDDNPINLNVLADLLEAHDFTVLVARNGKEALETAPYALPDLILLDVMMPGIDGFETCQKLQADAATQEIPIIFMTALAGTNNKVKGFSVGAVDYITKPFQHEEVIARVNTHLALQEQKRALARLNADKDKFFSIISHDLQAPFNSLLSLSQFLFLGVDTRTEAETRHMAKEIYQSAKVAYDLLQNLLTWSLMQKGQMTYHPDTLNLHQLTQQAITLWKDIAAEKELLLTNLVQPDQTVLADKNMMATIIRNLLSNAIKFTPHQGEITISAQLGKNGHDSPLVTVSVADTGVGMSQEAVNQLFRSDIHYTTPGTNDEVGTGLGLLLCQELVEKQGGHLTLDTEVDQGTTICFTLPLPPSY